MPRCADCLHAGDRHAERNAGLAPPDDDETVFPCLDCRCGDYSPELTALVLLQRDLIFHPRSRGLWPKQGMA